MHCRGAKSGWQLGDGHGAGKIDTTRARLTRGANIAHRGQYIPGRANVCMCVYEFHIYLFIYLFTDSLPSACPSSPCKFVPETKAPASFSISLTAM